MFFSILLGLLLVGSAVAASLALAKAQRNHPQARSLWSTKQSVIKMREYSNSGYYRTAILCHGLAGSGDSFFLTSSADYVKFLQQLGFRVLVIDWRAKCGSTWESLSRDINSAVDCVVPAEETLLWIGHSLGGSFPLQRTTPLKIVMMATPVDRFSVDPSIRYMGKILTVWPWYLPVRFVSLLLTGTGFGLTFWIGARWRDRCRLLATGRDISSSLLADLNTHYAIRKQMNASVADMMILTGDRDLICRPAAIADDLPAQMVVLSPKGGVYHNDFLASPVVGSHVFPTVRDFIEKSSKNIYL